MTDLPVPPLFIELTALYRQHGVILIVVPMHAVSFYGPSFESNTCLDRRLQVDRALRRPRVMQRRIPGALTFLKCL